MVNHSQVGVKLIQDDGVRLRTNHYYEQKKTLEVDHFRDSMACLTNVCTLLKSRRLSLGNTTSNLHWSVLHSVTE